jgi:hypothetical protein
MKLYEVEVFLGGGGDTDNIATYLVYAMNESAAEAEALGESRSLINAKANLVRNTDLDEIDYDGILGPQRFRLSGLP